ncbi:MAG TPA: UDP-3-O-acyl-N-acetylglucosamine deacetylase [Methylomirabilota bacterium]|nr:UDP-3-O-acyl-N-acetylglucosamine deacetylase [Methylomirabilota bacterium]
MDQQQTLRHPVEIAGIGLHSGEPVALRVSPAGADTGVLFRATDGTLIPANADHVVDTNSATTVGAFGVRVRTIEHLMAAAAALGIDNMVVDLDGPEVPAADGSAKPFMDLLRSAGCVSLPAPRRPLTVSEPIRVGTESRWLEVLPADSLRISYTLDNNHPIIGLQVGTYGITEQVFDQELAAARTYGFLRDVPVMRQNGLARGGSLENAVVVGKRSVLNDSLRFPDEFVRHKILDLVGDLFLLGRPLRAHVVGRNAGHALNHQLVVAILKAVAADRRRVVARSIRPAVPATVGTTGEGFLPGIAAL